MCYLVGFSHYLRGEQLPVHTRVLEEYRTFYHQYSDKREVRRRAGEPVLNGLCLKPGALGSPPSAHPSLEYTSG